jgi:hypothetical protein
MDGSETAFTQELDHGVLGTKIVLWGLSLSHGDEESKGKAEQEAVRVTKNGEVANEAGVKVVEGEKRQHKLWGLLPAGFYGQTG